MKDLDQVLSVLLDAEDEAERTVEESRRQAATLLEGVKRAFYAESEQRLATAREQARTRMEGARATSEDEARHLSQLAQQERNALANHARERMEPLARDVAREVAERWIGRGRDFVPLP